MTNQIHEALNCNAYSRTSVPSLNGKETVSRQVIDEDVAALLRYTEGKDVIKPLPVLIETDIRCSPIAGGMHTEPYGNESSSLPILAWAAVFEPEAWQNKTFVIDGLTGDVGIRLVYERCDGYWKRHLSVYSVPYTYEI